MKLFAGAILVNPRAKLQPAQRKFYGVECRDSGDMWDRGLADRTLVVSGITLEWRALEGFV
jgi:hypothetical protein